jgi:hypothetical protein
MRCTCFNNVMYCIESRDREKNYIPTSQAKDKVIVARLRLVFLAWRPSLSYMYVVSYKIRTKTPPSHSLDTLFKKIFHTFTQVEKKKTITEFSKNCIYILFLIF